MPQKTMLRLEAPKNSAGGILMNSKVRKQVWVYFRPADASFIKIGRVRLFLSVTFDGLQMDIDNTTKHQVTHHLALVDLFTACQTDHSSLFPILRSDGPTPSCIRVDTIEREVFVRTEINPISKSEIHVLNTDWNDMDDIIAPCPVPPLDPEAEFYLAVLRSCEQSKTKIENKKQRKNGAASITDTEPPLAPAGPAPGAALANGGTPGDGTGNGGTAGGGGSGMTDANDNAEDVDLPPGL